MADVLLPGVGRGSVAGAIAPAIAAPSFSGPGMQLAPASPASLLGATLKREWDARTGTAANTWTDTVASTVMTGTGSPTFGADPGYFNGLSVWQFLGSQYLDTGNIAEFVAADAEIWICVVGRITNADGANRTIFQVRNDQGSNFNAYSLRQNTITTMALSWEAAVFSSIASPANTSAHRYEVIARGGRRQLYVDGVLLQNAVGAASGRNVERVALPTVSASTSAVNVGLIRIATPAPTGIQLEQMRAYDRAIWGTP